MRGVCVEIRGSVRQRTRAASATPRTREIRTKDLLDLACGVRVWRSPGRLPVDIEHGDLSVGEL
jgi:AMMECR1 domain-containing protein